MKKYGWNPYWLGLGWGMLFIGVFSGDDTQRMAWMFPGALIAYIVWPIYYFVFYRRRPDVRERRAAEKAKDWAKRAERQAACPREVSAELISTDSRTKAGSAVGRAVVGGALLGPAGLAAGLSGKKKQTATFSIRWSDGRRTTETVPVGGGRFNALMNLKNG